MKYLVKISDKHTHTPYRVRYNTFAEFRAWLEENVGVEQKDWAWVTGDLYAWGIFLPSEELVILFKLRFEL